MKKNKNKIRIITFTALLCALSAVLAYFCKFFTIGTSIRITFENLPLILCGYVFGPAAGAAAGIAADFIGTAVSQYGLGGMNPIITAGAGCVGFFAGMIPKLLGKKEGGKKLFCSVAVSHIIGNIIVKSVGLRVYFGTPFQVLLIRIPLYAAIAAAEGTVLYFLLKNKGIKKSLGGGL